MLHIRSERKEDFSAIHSLIRDSFSTAKASEGDEQEFVAVMRLHLGYIPDLAMVAERDGVLAAYVMLTETSITGPDASWSVLLLAPLCVGSDFQGMGVGSALLREALRRAKERSFAAVFLAGDPAYYNRFGFHSVKEYGIGHELSVPDRYILACELEPGFLAGRRGVVILTGHDSCAAATGVVAGRVSREDCLVSGA